MEAPPVPEPSQADEPSDAHAPLWSQSGNSKVKADYGLAVVREGAFRTEAKVKPWSAYWYPSRDEWLFFKPAGTERAPLQKYDDWVKKVHHQEAGATDYEASVFDPGSKNFEGLCSAWAMASVLQPEPRQSKELDQVKFGTADLKALLIKTYESIEGVRTYGKSPAESEEVCQGICPDQFHRVLQAELFEKGLPIIMNKDPGAAVWTYPIYAVEWSITHDEQDPHIMHVEALVKTAGPFQADQLGALGMASVSFHYTYDLYGIPELDGSLEVHAGGWTQDSITNHPGFLAIPPVGRQRHHSLNPKIQTELVDEILAKARRT